MGVGGQRHTPAALPQGKRPGIHCIGGWVGTRAGLDGCGKSRPIGIRSRVRPARSESLYRLSHPSPRPTTGLKIFEVRSITCNRSGPFGDMSLAPEVVWTFFRKQQGPIPGLDVSETMIIYCVCRQQKSGLLSRPAFGIVTVGLSFLDP
jgi:hypothetical protein